MARWNRGDETGRDEKTKQATSRRRRGGSKPGEKERGNTL